MGATHQRGATLSTRLGCVPVRHTYVVKNATTTDAVSTGIVIQASTESPVIVEAQVCVSTVDGGGSPTLSVGYTGANYTDLISTASTATAATGGTFLPASNAVGKKRLTDTTTIYYKQGGTPDGAGVTTIILDVSDVNTTA